MKHGATLYVLYVLLWQFSLASCNNILMRHFSCDGLSCHNKPYEPLEVILVCLAVVLNCCNRSYFLYWTQIHKNIYSIHHQLRKSHLVPKKSTFTNPKKKKKYIYIYIYPYKTLENIFSTHRKQIVNKPTTNHTKKKKNLRFNYKKERVKWESEEKEENLTIISNGSDEELIELIFIENDLN